MNIIDLLYTSIAFGKSYKTLYSSRDGHKGEAPISNVLIIETACKRATKPYVTVQDVNLSKCFAILT